MLGYYTLKVYRQKVQALVDKGMPHKDAKLLIQYEEKLALWDHQRDLEAEAWHNEHGYGD